MKNYNKEIRKLNKEIKKLNINKVKKYLKDYYKNNLKSYCGLPETIKKINNMKKRELYYEYIYEIYTIPF